MDSNLLRIAYEVENNLQWIHPTMTFLQFTRSSLPSYKLAMLFLTHYERPLNPLQPWRGTQAEFWFKFLGGKKKSKPYMYLTKKRRILIQ